VKSVSALAAAFMACVNSRTRGFGIQKSQIFTELRAAVDAGPHVFGLAAVADQHLT
jgi:hypothetical protein